MSASGWPNERKAFCSVVIDKDGGVILDIESDRLLKLNPTGAEVWKLLHDGETESQIALKISKRYGIAEERAAEDVRVLLGKFSKLGVSPHHSAQIDQNGTGSEGAKHTFFPWYGHNGVDSGRQPKCITVVCALVGLAAFDLVLWLCSLRFLCLLIRKWPVKTSSTSSYLIETVCKAVDKACVWYPRRAWCLQRAAVTTCLLRSFGVPARMLVGARTMPLLAHAWVEVDDSVVNDWPHVRDFYRTLSSY
jgi:Transglutaminase-like superfamily/Coenzyme PQQ synthesis protein D (PqqD)